VFRKITQGAVKIARGEEHGLVLGNLDSVRDWGFAGDYVRAMWLQLQYVDPDDFVIATGKARSVRHLCEVAFSKVGLDYREFVKSEPRFWRPAEPTALVGNASKARDLLEWVPEVTFDELVNMMIQTEELGLVDSID
jgi:GDPmannose 4,6-dehydratase